MKSLRVRLTLWFTLGFLAVAAIFILFTFYRLDVQLRRDSFSREQKTNPDWILRGSYSEEEVQEIMWQLVQSSLIVSLPAVLLVIGLGYVIARQSLRPIEGLNRQLQEITTRTLERRVELPEEDEQFISLRRHLNDMLSRLEGSFAGMSEYAAKVAHELRTPLTILRHKVEQSQGRIEPELAEDLQEELLRLSHVVDQSLLIAKAGQGRLAWNPDAVDLAALLRDLVQDFQLLAEAEQRRLVLEALPACTVRTDARYCKQILHALLSNALIHGRGTIRIRLVRRRTVARLIILNTVRATPTRSELTLGLGLRVVRALVAQQPDLRLRQHHGSRLHVVGLRLPAVEAASPGITADRPSGTGAGLKLAVAALLLGLAGTRLTRGEDRVDDKFEYYAEDGHRIQVLTHSTLFEADAAPGLAFKGSVVYDSISGASPNGGPPLSGSSRVRTLSVHDARTAGTLEVGARWGAQTFKPQLAYSTEHDYESLAPSLNYVVDFNERNTTLTLGACRNFDRQIRGFYVARPQRKDSIDVLAGLTQVLTPTTLLNVTMTFGTAAGYLSDPYKGFRFTGYPVETVLFPEHRPGHRTKQILSASFTQFVDPAHASLETTYRFYHDSFGLFAHTVTLEWFQNLGRYVVLSPLFRYYRQSAADFYRLQFDADPSDNSNPNNAFVPEFYSSDYRLSRLQTFSWGLGVRVKLRRQLFAEAAWRRYIMEGLDGATAASNYPRANVYTAGLTLHF